MQADGMESLGARLVQLLGAFLRLGSTAFGGPAVHIAMFDAEFVGRRKWLTREHFLDLLAVTNLLPGPNSTEMAIHLGYLRAGFLGALVAGVAFIGPSFLMVWVLSWGYVTYGQLPEVAPILRGIGPVVVAIIADAAWRLGRTAATRLVSVVLLLLAFGAALLGVHELGVLLAAGLAGLALSARARARLLRLRPPTGLWLAVAGMGLAVPDPTRLTALALFFLRTGAVLFGSGYLLISFIERDLVQTYGWLTARQVLDAIALGQLTPGPLSTTATFVGYLVAGDAGAVVATVAMFLPAFLVVFLTSPFIGRLRDSVLARAFLDGLQPAVVGLLAATVLRLGRGAVGDLPELVMGLIAFAVLARWRINAVWLLAAGAVAGVLLGLR